MYCPTCGAEIDASAKFCGKCGTRVNETDGQNEPAGDASTVSRPSVTKRAPRRSVAKVIGACSIAVTLVCGVAYALHVTGRSTLSNDDSNGGSTSVAELEEPALDGDASLVVYSDSGYQMTDFDITLIDDDGESAAYHVDHAWDGYLISQLGVRDGTYEVIVTDQRSGDSASLGDVVVNSQSDRAKTYEIGTEDEAHAEEAWSYMDTATNKLEAANLFWEQCQELQEKYGTPSTFTDAEFNFVYPTGLCFVDLIDVNEDGEDEMVVCYCDQSILEENIANRSPYGSTIKDPGWVQVFQYNRQYHDLYNALATSLRFRAGKGAIAFANDAPVGVSLVNCDMNANCYWRYDFSGEHPEGKVFGDFGGYQRNGERVGPTEAEQGIYDLLSNCTLYNLCGEVDPSIPAEVLPYSEAERVTSETLDYLSHADEILFENPKSDSQ